MKVKSINKIKIKERLKKTDKEAYDLIIALEDIIKKQKELTIKAINKLKKT